MEFDAKSNQKTGKIVDQLPRVCLSVFVCARVCVCVCAWIHVRLCATISVIRVYVCMFLK